MYGVEIGKLAEPGTNRLTELSSTFQSFTPKKRGSNRLDREYDRAMSSPRYLPVHFPFQKITRLLGSKRLV
jgi:hypothetical protein